MRALASFLAGIIIGVAAHWYFTQPKPQAALAEAGQDVRRETTQLGQNLKEKMESERIKEELERTGKVIREKARKAGDVIATAAANTSTTAAIKAKLLQTSNLAALKIDVDSNEGVVTLSGTVSSYDEIEQAINVALETEGVHKVVSALQVKPK